MYPSDPPSPSWPPAERRADRTAGQPADAEPAAEHRWAPAPPPPGWTPAASPPAHLLPSGVPPPPAYLLPSDVPPPPAPPARPKGRRWLLLAGIGCLLLALLSGLLAVAQYRQDQSPQRVVRRYLSALAAGDAPAALGYAVVPPRGSYLTAEVLREQLRLAPLADPVVLGSQLSGDRGTVSVRYRLRFADGDQLLTDTVPVIRDGSSWRLGRVAVATQVAVTSPGADRLTLAGGRLPSGPVLLFPGALPLGTDNPAVQVDGRPSVRLGPDDRQTSEVTVSLTTAAKDELQRGLASALAGCLAGNSAPDCPDAGDSRPVPGSLRGTALPLSQPLQISLGIGGVLQLAGTVTVRGSWQVWDFNNQPVRRTGDTDLDLHASASIADLNTVYWSRL
jgi:hypothetical protein